MLFKRDSHFAQEALFNQPESVGEAVHRLGQETAAKQKVIPNRTLEDWALRLATCADEAYSEKLGPLESDLLDLRDEILFELLSNI